MKKLICTLWILLSATAMFGQKNYAKEWRQVDSLLYKQLPQSANKILDEIFQEAQEQNNAPQIIKVFLYRRWWPSVVDNGLFVESVRRLEEAITTVNEPSKNILHSIAAEHYGQYYNRNRWQLRNRTDTDTQPQDVRTWSARQIIEKCIEHYAASLASPELLQQMRIESFDAIIYRHHTHHEYRPTLFDLLAFRAIDFFSKNVADLIQPQIQFTLSNPDYFGPAANFATLPLTTPDTLSYKFQALKWLQQAIAFHLHDPNPTALIDADLQRLELIYTHTELEEKENLYLNALYTLDSCYAAHPASVAILYHIAKVCDQLGNNYKPYANPAPQWKKREALAFIDKAIERFPNHDDAKSLLQLKKAIEQPQTMLTTEDAILPQKANLVSLQYKNVSTVYYKIVPLDYKAIGSIIESSEQQIKRYAQIPAAATGSWVMPKTEDYQLHTVEQILPPLTEGYYAILLATDPHFSETSALLAAKRVWVSTISYIYKNNLNSTSLRILHRETGQPLSNVEVAIYNRVYDNMENRYMHTLIDTLVSDSQGTVVYKANANNPSNNLNFLFTLKNDQYSSTESMYRFTGTGNTSVSASFFTDRSIYRPGQTIYFKGVVLTHDNLETDILAHSKQTISLHNVNGEKISDLSVVTNEFGSFSGSFAIPATGLTGWMNLRIEPANGSYSFSVEEYKRPKFEVRFEPSLTPYRFGEEIEVTGKALMYAGNPLSAGTVNYRIVREAYYHSRSVEEKMPLPYVHVPRQEIDHGTLEIGADGTFTLSFTPLPLPHIDKRYRPVFHYTIYTSIRDTNGETHEFQTSKLVGFHSLVVSTNIPEKVNICQWDTLEIRATNLSGQKQPAQGAFTVWKLREPNRALHERRWERPDQFSMTRDRFEQLFPHQVYDDENNRSRWEEEKVLTLSFNTQEATKYHLPQIQQWRSGTYRAVLAAQDAFGEPVTNSVVFSVFSPLQKDIPTTEIARLEVLHAIAHPGDTAKIVIGSALENVQAFYELTWNRNESQTAPITLNREQKVIHIPIEEKHRGNVGITLYFVKNNRPYHVNRTIQVPFDHKKLTWEFASFRNKLLPGAEEEWRITIKDRNGDGVAAELLASMYDASLDIFRQHNWYFYPWNSHYTLNYSNGSAFNAQKGNVLTPSIPYPGNLLRFYPRLLDYVHFRDNAMRAAPPQGASIQEVIVIGYSTVNKVSYTDATVTLSGPPISYSSGPALEEDVVQSTRPPELTAPPQIRTNFNETAFFYPQLRTNEKGGTTIHFTVPESLTRWKMQGLAWTKDLKVGAIVKELVTQKELMIMSNPPRFFREKDTLWFSAKISNISDKTLDVKTEVQFFDALTMKPVSERLLLENGIKSIRLASGSNQAVSWKIHIPERLQAITYRITAVSNHFSDGEESTVPVLTNRMLVTESLSLPIRGNETKSFEFSKLLRNKSKTLTHHAYTLELTSNPAWNAIQALPYLMEYPYDCVEQIFSRYYANSVATHIIHSNPKIKQIFDIWRNYQPDALQSNLEKNQELKALLLEETPWVRAAQNESERKQQIALLLDLNKMADEMTFALRKMEQAQHANGGFAWFHGGPDNRYMTQHLVAGMGHLQKMGILTQHTDSLLLKAISYLDTRITEEFTELKRRAEKEKFNYTNSDHLLPISIHYLYARSFFFHSHPIPQSATEAFSFYIDQTSRFWTNHNNVYLKGMIALALHRYGEQKTVKQIMQSLTETAQHHNEMGMYWRANRWSWWWYQAPIETQTLMIEAYHEILNDQNSVEELKLWLLKQKQTQDWKTTKATAEAIYALLLTGDNPLTHDDLCQITVGTHTLDPYTLEEGNRPQAGAGYFKTSWRGEEIQPDMGKITVTNPNPTAAWGAAYWQYFEELHKVTPAHTGLKINKRLYVKVHTDRGPLLKEVTPRTPINVGDKVTVRIEIRSDRDMEYVHLKDMRAAAFEPVNVLSGYRWQDGLGYYESIRDAAANFFISYLPKGIYVFEYDLFATQQGEFSNGITTLQCMYAPEFTTHSEGAKVRID